MSSFEVFESHISQCITEAQNLLREATLQGNPSLITEAKKKIDDARVTSGELQRELVMLPTNDKQQAQRRYQTIKEQIADLESRIQSTYDRQQLLGESYDLRKSASNSANLNKIQQYGVEAISFGTEVKSNLKSQRERLLNIDNNINSTDTIVSSASNMIGSMTRTQRTNKIIMYAVVALLVFAIVFIIYLQVF